MKFSNEKLGIEKIHHVAIAVADMESSLILWRDLLGFKPIVQDFPQHKMVEAAFYVGEVQVQIYASTVPNERFSNWTSIHGDGPHHVCYQVADINKTIVAIREAGMEIVEKEPAAGSQGIHVLIKPEFTNNVEVEFLELHDFLKGLTTEEAEKIVKEKFGR